MVKVVNKYGEIKEVSEFVANNHQAMIAQQYTLYEVATSKEEGKGKPGRKPKGADDLLD